MVLELIIIKRHSLRAGKNPTPSPHMNTTDAIDTANKVKIYTCSSLRCSPSSPLAVALMSSGARMGSAFFQKA